MTYMKNKKYKYDVYLSIGVEIESNMDYNSNDGDKSYNKLIDMAINKAKKAYNTNFNVVEIQKLDNE